MKGSAASAFVLVLAGNAFAQATVEEDGQWRAALGAGFASATGNTRSTSINLDADAVQATRQYKWAAYANALYTRSDGDETADQARLGTKYDWNLGPQAYAFGNAEFERDRIADLESRLTLGGGGGWRFVQTPELGFEVFGGIAHVSERYDGERLLDGRLRERYRYPTLLLGQASTHRLTGSTTASQRLAIYPNLENRGEYRAQWEGKLAVAINQTLSLTAGLTVKTNSDPGDAVKKTDTLLTSGISLRFE